LDAGTCTNDVAEHKLTTMLWLEWSRQIPSH
jgi:hypothetical protein